MNKINSYEKKRKEKKTLMRVLIFLGILIAITPVVVLSGSMGIFQQSAEYPDDPHEEARPVMAEMVSVTHVSMPSKTPDPTATPEPTGTPKAEDEEDDKTIAVKSENKSAFDMYGGEKICYITIDDGPYPDVTERYLDVLREQNVPATFFVLGERAESNKDLVRKIADEGHKIANHSYSHKYKQIYSSIEAFMDDKTKADKVFMEILGDRYEGDVYRFPGGSFKRDKFKSVLSEQGIHFYDWNVQDGDGTNCSQDVDTFRANLLQDIKIFENENKTKMIVLLHDTPKAVNSTKILPWLINHVREMGFEFDVLS